MVVLIGIGQYLRGDDAAGLTAVQLWQEAHPATAKKVRVELAENPGVGLLSLLEGADAAILVDAVQSGAAPGTIHHLQESDLASFLDGADSAHGWGVAETLALGRKIDPENLPTRMIVIGIEAGQIAIGERISPEVVSTLEKAAQLIQKSVEDLLES